MQKKQGKVFVIKRSQSPGAIDPLADRSGMRVFQQILDACHSQKISPSGSRHLSESTAAKDLILFLGSIVEIVDQQIVKESPLPRIGYGMEAF